jgi:hypothetical protein
MKLPSSHRAQRLTTLSSMGPGAWLAFLAACALLCACITFWAMQLSAPKPLVAPHGDGQIRRERADVRAASALFGQPAAEPAQQQAPVLGNVQVLGVVVAGRLGSAILIVDGQPARSYAVGETIGPGQRISRVGSDFIVIDDNGKPAQVPAPERGSIAVLTAGAAQPRAPSDPSLAAPVPGNRLAMPGGAGFGAPPRMLMPGPANAGIAPPANSPDAAAPLEATPQPVPGEPPAEPGRPSSPQG